MELPEDLLCLFNAKVQERNGSHLIEVPEREIHIGDVEAGDIYCVAISPQGHSHQGLSCNQNEHSDERIDSPVEHGEVIEVEIEDVGDKGDGIARIGGFVVIVKWADKGNRVPAKITRVRENMAFAEVVEGGTGR